MNHVTGAYTAHDGTRLFTQAWLPDDEPKAVIFLIHGYAEHSGRYRHVGEFLAGRGYAVYTMDLRGHGQSDGFRADIDRYETYLDDLYGYFQEVKAANAGRRIFVLGHSMGGILALAFAARHQEELTGVITSGAAVSMGDAVPGYMKAISRLLAAVAPRLPVMPLDAETISRDPAVRAAYDADPLNYRGKVRARMGAQMLALAQDAQERLPQITIPVLSMHGSKDVLADPEGLRVIERTIGSSDKTMRLYEGLYHEIFNEPEKEQVLNDMAAWLDSHS